jgi:uncharacterized membrane protein HdeD (DUF308 family)
MKTLKKYWWLTLLRGIVLIILAIMIFRHPLNALLGVSIYISVSLLVTGVMAIFLSFASKGNGWTLIMGLIDVFFAYILLSNPVVTASTLPFVVGFWVIVSGVISFVNSFDDKSNGLPYWWLTMLGGILSIFVGFVLTKNMLAGSLAISYWLGIGVLFAGIASIGIAIGMKTVQKELE